MEQVTVPHSVPLLPLEAVLLPSAYLRVTIPASPGNSRADLCEYLSTLSSDVIVAVLPERVLPWQVPLVELSGRIATAARVLQVSRLLQASSSCHSAEWVLLLEGLCRVQLDGLAPSCGPGVKGEEGEGEGGLEELGHELRAATKRLLDLIQQLAVLPAAKRVAQMLEGLPAERAADIVAAERLAVLHAVAPAARVRLALALVRHALTTLQAAGAQGSRAGARRGAGGQPPRRPGQVSPRRLSGLGAAPFSGQQQPQGPRSTTSSGSKDSTAGQGSPSSSSSSGGGVGGGGAGEAGPGGGSVRGEGGPGPPGWDPSFDGEEEEDELEAVMERLARQRPPPEVLRAAGREFRRLRQSGDSQPGAAASRAYLEVLADLPWSCSAADLQRPTTSPSPSLRPDPAGSPGSSGLRPSPAATTMPSAPPQAEGAGRGGAGGAGVGKTSLARSVAQVLQRPFVRIALGGVRDEAEVRGHRRTYVGAMPGRILQGIRRAGVRDPVMLLDELDKLGKDAVRGDPAAALLEVLDPEQNPHFTDTYLGLPFDLSRVTFLVTANRAADIPPPLLDRLEVLPLSGYTREEKEHIGSTHLLPRALTQHGLSADRVQLAPGVMRFICESYTQEAGLLLRLEGQAAAHLHALQARQQRGQLQGQRRQRRQQQQQHARAQPVVVSCGLVERVLGAPRFSPAGEAALRVSGPGAAAGLVWTAVGGGVQYIECVRISPGQQGRLGRLTLTGQVGEVLEESAQIAMSWIRAHAEELGLLAQPPPAWQQAAPLPPFVALKEVEEVDQVEQDGPSAGITLAVALVSLLAGRAARADTAMTGELTLRGLVLPQAGLCWLLPLLLLLLAQLWGLRGGCLAADVSKEVRSAITIIPVERLEQVLSAAFDPPFTLVPALSSKL
ncbi:hypothetical protein V8C86DRAFT_2430812 [Haematococcus lacustris]